MDHGVVHATFVELSDNPLSPDTSEFVALERQIMDQEPCQLPLPPPPPLPTLEENPSPMATPPPTPPPPPNFVLDSDSSSRKTSDIIQREIEAEEQHRLLLQSELEEKLEERKRSLDLNSENGLQLMERRQFRQFSRADEYLYAMKEDLAEWMNNLYPHIDMDADNFMNKLETGEHLVQHGNAVRQKWLDLVDLIAEGKTKQRPPNFEVPDRELPCRFNVQPGTWFARDNVFNFILFCRKLGVMECIMFETEDLVCRKNEKHVILTLLEVARRGAKLGMLAPMLVQFEQEIDREIAREERKKRKEEEKQRKEEEKLRKEEEKRKRDEERKLAELKRRQKELEDAALAAESAANGGGCGGLFGNHDVFDSMQVNIDDDGLIMEDVEDLGHDLGDSDDLDDDDDEYDDDDEEDEDDDDDVDDMEGYEMPIGPLPQLVTNDLKSLDEMVREIVSECQCPTQFPMIRVSEGKYRIGDTQTLIFVRILRNHVMVRVGGGWDTLQHYLDKHDPCRCAKGHKSASHAQITMKNGRNGPVAVGVCYDRSDSGSPRRRSSTTNLNNLGRRSSSLTQQNNNSASTTTINTTPSTHRVPIPSPKSRSSSSQQLPIVTSKARSLYAKQGSANLLLQNSSGLSAPNSHKSVNKTALAKSVSLQPTGFSTSGSSMVEQKKSKDTLSTCDSSSEVSDEGYKSSQGNVTNSGTSPSNGRSTDLSNKSCANSSETSSHEGRPESSLTVASECSSTISSEEEQSNLEANKEQKQPQLTSNEVTKEDSLVPPPASPTNSSISSDEDDCGTWHTPTNQTTPVKIKEAVQLNEAVEATTKKSDEKKNRFSNLFNRFKMKNNHSASTHTVSDTSKDVEKSSRPAFSRSNSMTSENGRGFVRNASERHSYKAPSATSRYMQAAEAYAAKNRASRSNNGTWSAASTKNSWNNSTSRGRSRPALNNDTFRPPSRPQSRTTSASPGPWRRRQYSGDQNSQTAATPPSSVHSTPRRKPVNTEHGSVKGHKSQKALADLDLDEEDAILKRMEEILLTYKSRVETHLAAEGRELPKEIFEDFTSQWVAAASNTAASSRPLSRSATTELNPENYSKPRVTVAPSPRKAKRDTSNTRIPMPTFYTNNN